MVSVAEQSCCVSSSLWTEATDRFFYCFVFAKCDTAAFKRDATRREWRSPSLMHVHKKVYIWELGVAVK